MTTVIAAAVWLLVLLGGAERSRQLPRALSDERRILRDGARPSLPRPLSRRRIRISRRATTACCSSGWCSRSTRPGCPGSPCCKKRAAFTAAFADWDLERVARFGARDVARLLADPGIIRNRLKIEAVIENARRILALRDRHGSFAALARRASPAAEGGVGPAVPRHVPLHRRRDRRRVPDEPRLSAGRACRISARCRRKSCVSGHPGPVPRPAKSRESRRARSSRNAQNPQKNKARSGQ